MAKKVENQDLFSGDVFLKTVADVELLILELNKLEATIVEVAKAQKTILGKSDTKSIEGIRATNDSIHKLNETEKMHLKLQRDKLSLESKLKAARTNEGQQNAELNYLLKEQNKINSQNVEMAKKEIEVKNKQKQAIIQQKQAAKDLAKQQKITAKEVEKAAKLSTKEAEIQNNAYKKLTKDTNEAQAKFKQLAAEFGVNSKQANAAIAEMTRAELKPVEQEIKKVSKSSINSSIEVAKLATTLFQLGKSSNDVKMLLRPIDDLSISLLATGEDTAKFLGQTLNAFGKGSASGQEFADIISNIAAKTALDFEGLSESFGYIAPSAKALNITVGKTGARLVDKGLSLDQALAKINESTNKTSTAAELFGTEAFTLGLILADNVEKTKRLADE